MNQSTLAASLLLFPALAFAGSADGLSFETGIRKVSTSLKETMAKPGAAKMAKPAEAKYAADPRCAPQAEGEPKVYSNDFRWDFDLPSMRAKFDEIYGSGKRLPARAFWNPETSRLELPHEASQGGNIVITEKLVRALSRHIERAFELDYIDGVFFPDMGHSHMLIPEALWSSKYDAFPISEKSRMYSTMFADPEVHIFYHTAEQLKVKEKDGSFVPGERYKRRYETRNIAGPITPDAELWMLQAPDSPANTAHEKDAPGYKWYGAGFNFSASKDGCFSYQKDGETFRYDISMDDLIQEPGSGGGDVYY